jgi:hypothetical protein
MPIPEAILNQIKCCFNNDGHFAIQPTSISCGAIACKKCFDDSKEEVIKCFSCNKNHERAELNKAPISKLAEIMVQTYLNDLFEYVETIKKKCIASVKGILIKN